MQFETQPPAAARLIGRGHQPLQPAQRHRGAVVRPKQRTSSLNKPCRALFSPAIPRCPPSKAPSKRPSQAAVVRQPPPPTNHRGRPRRQSSSASGFLGLKYGCRRLDSASSRRRRRKRETTEKGKSQRERPCPCFCIRREAPTCWRRAFSINALLVHHAMLSLSCAALRSFCCPSSVRPAASTA